MPLVRRGTADARPGAKIPGDTAVELIDALKAEDADRRWNAARMLGDHPGAVPALAAALGAEQSPRVREALMTALMRIGDSASARAVLPYLRSQDASVRSSAVEALQAMTGIVRPFVTQLFRDADSDVRLLACELTRNLPAEEATAILCTLIESEPHANVCAAAVEVLAEVGTSTALPVLLQCAKRFSGDSFLPFAISVAAARIRGTDN